MTENSLLKIGEAAKFLKVSIDTLRRWEKAGKIASIRTPGGTRLYPLSVLEKLKYGTDEGTYSVSQAAQQLGVSVKTLRRWDKEGKLPVERNNKGERVYLVEHLDKNLALQGQALQGSQPQPVSNTTSDSQLHPLWENTTSAITPITHISHIPSKPHLSSKKLTLFASISFLSFLLITSLVFASLTFVPSLSDLTVKLIGGINSSKVKQPSGQTQSSSNYSSVLAAETVKQILEINADTNIYGLLTSEGLTINGAGSFTSLTASSSATFSGPATFNGGLTSTGNTTLSNLSILGPTTLTNTSTSNSLVINDESSDTTPFVVDSSGNVGIGTTSTNSYKAYISGTLYTSGASSFGSTLAVTGATTLSSTLTVSGASTLSSTLEVSGKLTAKDELAVSGATTLSGALTTSGATTLSSTLAVTGASTFSSTGTFSGKLTSLGNVGIAGNVGIGTTSPVTLLDVNNKLNVLSGGNVGVGTTSPAFKLQVAGDLGPSLDATYNLGSASNQWKNLYLSGISAIGGQATFTSSPTGTGVGDGVVYINPPSVADNSYTLFGIAVGGTEKLRMDGNGNITVQGNLLGPEGGSIGYWSRAGTTLYPYTSGDHITTTGNVGIGTTVPAAKLNILGAGTSTALSFLTRDSSGTNRFAILDNGNVGIGTTSPNKLLHLYGEHGSGAKFEANAGVSQADIDIRLVKGTATSYGTLGFYTGDTRNYFLSNYNDGTFRISRDSVHTDLILNNGNVGIGTTSPNAFLHIRSGSSATPDLILDSSTEGGSNNDKTISFRENNSVVWDIKVVGDGDSLQFTNGSLYGFLATDFYGLKTRIGTTSIGTDITNSAMFGVAGSAAIGSGYINNTPAQANGLIVEGNVGIGTTVLNAKLSVLGGNVGIGTTSTVSLLDVNNLFNVLSNGNIGIGNINPLSKLHVGAGADAPERVDQTTLYASNAGTTYLTVRDSQNDVDVILGAHENGVGLVGSRTNHPLHFQTNANTRMALDAGGNLGIGATTPGGKLTITGGNVGIGTTSPTSFNLEIAGSIGPTASSTYNLGSSSKKWANLYVDNIVTSGDTSITAGTASTALGDGADGAITVSSSKNLNTTNVITGRSCTDGGDMVSYNVTSVTDSNTVVLESAIASGCLVAGDEVLLINLQGTSSNYTNVGNYETFTIDSISTTSVANDTVNFTATKTKYYGDGASDDTNIGTATTNQRVILQRVPNYTNVTVSSGGTITGDDWDGAEGGVLFFRASGTIDVQSGGTISMAGKGYRSGNAGGVQGESYGGTGAVSGSANLGGGGGRGGNDYGGGGGYGAGGSDGQNGLGGSTYGVAALTKLYPGSGGGAGNGSNSGDGGGIIFVSANTLTVSGTANNNGNNGTNYGGGGSGGSTYLLSPNLTVGSSLVTASGGAKHGCCSGNGAVGRVRLDYNTISGTTSPTAGSTNSISSPGLTINQQGIGHILSLQSGGTEKFYVDNQGSIHITNTSSAGNIASFTVNSQTIGNVFDITGTGLTTGNLFNLKPTFSSATSTGNSIYALITDSTTNTGGYSGIKIDTAGSGTGVGNKYLLDLNSASSAKFTVDTSGNTSIAGNLYSDSLNLIGGTSSSPAQNIGLGTGADGAITVSTSKNLNTTNVINGRTCTDGGDMVSYNVTSVTDSNTVVLESAVASGCLVAGDEVLLINIQGTSTNYTNTGNWETLKIDSVSSDTVNFTTNKTKYYGDNSYDDTNIGTATTNQRVILQRVPNYTNITVASGGTITADDWDGAEGGILFFRASGTVDVQSGGTITMAGKGYRGAATDIQGESYGGTGSSNITANLGGGGGAAGYDYGAGGGYGAAGGNADYATGGSTYGSADLTKLYPGSGGGAGTNSNSGDGGGIVFISANTLTVTSTGVINNNGNNGTNYGGGGSGGSTYLLSPNLTVGSSLVTASGGTGHGCCSGAGGVGRIRLDYTTLSGTTSPAVGSSNSSSPQLVINEKGIDKIISLQNSGNERLYVDANGNLILNSSSPSGTTQLLDIRSLSSSKFTILSNGNIGIGTTTPGNLLSLTGGNVGIGTTATINGAMAIMGGNVGVGVTNPSAPLMVIGGGTTTGFLSRFQDSAYTDRVTILDNGNVGIGTTSPNYPLEVSGAAGIAAWSTSGGTIRLHTHERDSAGSYYPTKITYTPVFLAPESNLLSFYVANGTANGAGTEGGRQVRVMNLTGAGNVGIGTTAPSAAFSVAENFKVTSAGVVTGGTYNKVTITAPASAATLTLADGSSLITSGAYSLTLTTTNTTDVTLPTTGTLTTLAGTESFSNKTFTGDTFFPSGIWNTGGNIGIGTTAPGVTLQLRSSTVAAGTPDTEEQFKLTRPINSGISYPQAASFALGTYSTNSVSNTYGPATRLDIKLKSTKVDDFNTDVTVMTLQDNGNVGIGITGPIAKLDLRGGAAATTLRLSSSVYPNWISGFDEAGTPAEAFRLSRPSSTSDLRVDTYSASNILLMPGGLGATAGNVGIGTTSPSAPLEVKGTGTSAVIAKFTDVTTTGCAIATDGTISCSSDISLKKNITSLDYGLSEVLKLRPVNYNWKNQDDSVTKNLGFIAQEVESIIPKLVSTDDTGLKQLNTIGMVPVLTKSIQELYSEISNLKDQISKIQTEASSSASSVILEGGDSRLIGSLDSIATPSASLQNDIFVVSEATISAQLTAYSATIQEVFKSLGETFLGNTTIAGSFSVDGTLSLTGNSLSTLGTLYLQNGPLAGDIDLFNGLVKIDNKGNAVAQTITTKNLVTNNLTIKQSESPTIGSGKILAGQTKTTIQTPALTSTSKVFITSTTLTDKPLSVIDLKPQQSFDVAITSPLNFDLEFNWWIIETQ